ncbi:hypothetical protein BCU79_12110 [Vibrio breoganii]|nr:hypothetical protein BCU79_12110 [Vibrio breoganii]PMI16109.1 hypothetical protein BCU49_02070 [Vibrio breoganii]
MSSVLKCLNMHFKGKLEVGRGIETALTQLFIKYRVPRGNFVKFFNNIVTHVIALIIYIKWLLESTNNYIFRFFV